MTKTHLLAIIAFVALAESAQANMGTPLMWAGMFHLVLGNLVIGVGEGILLARLYHLRAMRCVGMLILANYLSAWIGVFALDWALKLAPSSDLSNIWMFFGWAIVGTYAMTLVIEFPFIAFAFPRGKPWRREAIRASLIIQTTSYVLLFSCYFTASQVSLLIGTDIVTAPSISLPQGVVIYYISSADGDVHAIGLGGSDPLNTFALNSTDGNDRLLVRPSSSNMNSWDLLARLEQDGRRDADLTTVLKGFASIAAPLPSDLVSEGPDRLTSPHNGTWSNFGPAPKLGSAQSSTWDFSTGSWAANGLSGTDSEGGAPVWIALETPFAEWLARNATHLPGDLVLLQLGSDQICLYDPHKSQIALIARGRGPVAIIRDADPK